MGMTVGAAGLGMSLAGNVSAGNAAAAAGRAKQQALNYSAASLQQQAMAARGAASQQAFNERRNTRLIQGTIQARAAASGAGAVNPTVVNLEQQNAGRGEYNVLSALYSGEERARGEENQAALDIFSGQQERIAGRQQQMASYMKGISSALTEGSSLYAKYGMGGVNGSSSDGTDLLSRMPSDL